MYLHEEQYYLISNHAVARNLIFCDIEIQMHFKNKMEFYLDPLCDILAYNLRDQEFQILVKLKDREAFELYYRSRNEDFQGYMQTPESTYLFSQAMANLQVSLVKKFNFLYHRRGTLMARRFSRELITSKEKVMNLITTLNEGNQERRYSGIWADCAMKRIAAMTSGDMYRALELGHGEGSNAFWSEFKDDLVVQFKTPSINVKEFKINFLNRKLFKSICRFLE